MALASCAGPEEPCFFDARCLGETEDPYGGLGCNAGGHFGCRFCGFGDYVEVECPAPPGVEQGGVQVMLTLAGDIDESWFNLDKPGPLNRFKALLRIDLAVLLGISYKRLLILDVRAGSIVIELVILPPADGTVNATSVTDALGVLRAALSADPPPTLVGMTPTALDVVQLEEAQSPSSPPFVTISALTSANLGGGDGSMALGAVGAAAVIMLLVAYAIRRRRRRRRLAGDKGRDPTPGDRRLSAAESGPVSLADIAAGTRARSNNASPAGMRKQRSHKGDEFDDFDAFGDARHRPTRTNRRSDRRPVLPGDKDANVPSYLPSAARLPAPEQKLLEDLGGGGRTPRIHTDDEESAPAMSRTTRLGPSGREAVGLDSKQGTRRGHIERPESMRTTPMGRTARALPLPSAAQLPAPYQSALPLPSAAQLPSHNFAQGKAAQRMKSHRDLNGMTSRQMTSRNSLTQRQSSDGTLATCRTMRADPHAAATRAAKRAKALESLTAKQQVVRELQRASLAEHAATDGPTGAKLPPAAASGRLVAVPMDAQNAPDGPYIARNKLKARRFAELESEPAGEVLAGTAVWVLERTEIVSKFETVPRACVAICSSDGEFTQVGWVSPIGRKSGTEMLTKPTDDDELGEDVMEAVASAAPVYMVMALSPPANSNAGVNTLPDAPSLPLPQPSLDGGHALPVPQSSPPAASPATSSAAAASSALGHAHFAGKVPTLAGGQSPSVAAPKRAVQRGTSTRLLRTGTGVDADIMDGFDTNFGFSGIDEASPSRAKSAHEDRFSLTSELPGQRASMDQVQDPLSSDRPLSSERPLSTSSDGTRTGSSEAGSSSTTRTPRAPVAAPPTAPPVLAESPRTPRLTPRSELTRVRI